MADIERVNVAGQVYDIRVPDGSSLSLSSLSVTGTISGANLNLGSGTITAGTATLSVVKNNKGPLTISMENTDCIELYNEYARHTISVEFPSSDIDHNFTLSLPAITSDQATLLTTENAPFVVIDSEMYGKGVEVKLKNINHIILLDVGINGDRESGPKITIGDEVVIGPLSNYPAKWIYIDA